MSWGEKNACALSYPGPRVCQSGEMQQEARRRVFTPRPFRSRSRTGGRQGPAHRRSVCSQQEAWAGKFGVRCLCPGSRSTERPCPWSVASPPQPGTTPCSCEWLPGPLWGQFRCCHQKAVTWISNETPDCELDGLLTSCPAVRPSEFLQQDEMTQEDRLIIEHGTVGSSHADIRDAPDSNRTLSRHRGPAEKA